MRNAGISVAAHPPTLLLMMACALGVTACTRPAPVTRQAPKIVFAQSAYDFGRVQQGTPVTHQFPFRNAGGVDLIVDNVRASCGCTAALTTTHVIAPGAVAAIHATYDTAHDFGSTHRTITVYSNDPTHPALTLTLSGDVAADVALTPAALYVGHLRRGQQAPDSARVVGDAAGTVHVGPVDTSGKAVGAALAPGAPGATGQVVQIRIRPDAPRGPFTEQVQVHTNSQRHPLLTLTVVGVVDGDVVVTPRQLNFGVIAPREKATRSLEVDNHGAKPIQVTGAILPAGLGQAKVVAVRPGQVLRVDVTLAGKLPVGPLVGSLQLRTNAPEEPRLVVPLTGRVEKRS